MTKVAKIANFGCVFSAGTWVARVAGTWVTLHGVIVALGLRTGRGGSGGSGGSRTTEPPNHPPPRPEPIPPPDHHPPVPTHRATRWVLHLRQYARTNPGAFAPPTHRRNVAQRLVRAEHVVHLAAPAVQ